MRALSLRDMLSLGSCRMGLGCSGEILPSPPPSPSPSILGLSFQIGLIEGRFVGAKPLQHPSPCGVVPQDLEHSTFCQMGSISYFFQIGSIDSCFRLGTFYQFFRLQHGLLFQIRSNEQLSKLGAFSNFSDCKHLVVIPIWEHVD